MFLKVFKGDEKKVIINNDNTLSFLLKRAKITKKDIVLVNISNDILKYKF